MKKAKVIPEMMDIIINCQMMIKKIDDNYNQYKGFKPLTKLTIDELRRVQDGLIELYNNTFKTV